MRISESIIAYKQMHPNCEACFKPALGWPHHIRSRGAGGSDDHDNLISLCSSCHVRIHTMGWVRFTQENPHIRDKIMAAKT